MKKAAAVLLAMSIILMCLAGCSTSQQSTDPDKPPSEGQSPDQSPNQNAPSGGTDEKVIFWGYWGGDVETQINELVEKYNQTAAVKVEYVPQGDMMTVFSTASVTGDAPDIMLWDASEVRKYALKGVLYDIDSHLLEAGISTNEYNAECIRELTYNGKLYGLPMNIDIWGIYVNMGIMKSLGLSAPRTWEQLMECAAKATLRDSSGALERSGLSMQWLPYMFTSFVVSNGSNVLTDDGTKTTVNNESGRQVLQFFTDLLDAGVYEIGFESGLAQGDDPFLTEKSAMVIWPTSMLRTYQTYGDKLDFTFVPMPAGPGPNARIGGIQTSWSLVIPEQSKNKDAAFDFLQFCLNDFDNSVAWCNIVGGFTPLVVAQNDPFFSENKYLVNVIDYIKGFKIRSDAPGFIQMEGSVFAPYIQQLFEGSISIDECLKGMQTDGDAMLAEYRE